MYTPNLISKISFVSLTLLLLTSQKSTSQSVYENFYYSNDQISIKANAVLSDSEEFIVVGETGISNVPNPSIKHDGIILKYSTDGRVIKQATFGGSEDDMFYDIEKTTDNGYIICGRTDSYGEGNADVLLVKCDVNLNVMWSKSYGGSGSSPIWGYDIGYDISPTSDGGFVVAGTTSSSYSTTPDRNDIYLLKVDAMGQLLWTKTFGKSNFDYAASVIEIQDGLIITGTSNFKTCIIKTDFSGNKIWAMEYSGDEGLATLETHDGQIVMLSYVAGISDPNGTVIPEKLLITKLDSDNGLVIWSKEYMIETDFFGLSYLFKRAVSMIKDQSDFVLAGSMDIYLPGAADPSQYNPFMIKFDSNGDLLWGRQYPHDDNVYIFDIEKINDGFVATGYHTEFPSGPINKKKSYLLKTDGFGESCNSQSFSPVYNNFIQLNSPLLENESTGGIENSFPLATQTTDFLREESCQQGCENIIIETSNYQIMEDASAHIKIETNGIVSSGISVDYHAGTEVLMTPLFEVFQDGVFHAFISPCN